MSLVGEERKELILELLQQEGKVKTTELVEKLQVSSESVRRYLEELEQEQRLRRVYGGAVKVSGDIELLSYKDDSEVCYSSVKDIAQVAANLVQHGESVALDDGIISLYMLPYLLEKQDVTIITCSVRLLQAFFLQEKKDEFTGDIYFLGGKVHQKHARVCGLMTEKMMEYFHADKAFLCVDGLSLQKGMSHHDAERAFLVRKFMENSKECIVLCDQDKLELQTFYKIADIKDIQTVICDSEIPEEWADKCQEWQVQWVNASRV
ncbi:DeoR/GlpR family DNA-binding transcription regulator [Brevibacillus laterosporus]|uniref:DeoR/GlpR family DNA-binding transcription regulator n=1 Tax=Brevibacillus laterosporus TaxID=1465 RepID=UPI003D20A4B0